MTDVGAYYFEGLLPISFCPSHCGGVSHGERSPQWHLLHHTITSPHSEPILPAGRGWQRLSITRANRPEHASQQLAAKPVDLSSVLIAIINQLFPFFFPALPDKCETWSVNNWNLSKIEIKFPQKKETNKGHKRTKTSNTHTQAKAPGKANLPGKFAN